MRQKSAVHAGGVAMLDTSRLAMVVAQRVYVYVRVVLDAVYRGEQVLNDVVRTQIYMRRLERCRYEPKNGRMVFQL